MNTYPVGASCHNLRVAARRQVPTVGAKVAVAYLGERVAGTIEEVGDNGRDLVVVTEAGEPVEFALSRATGHFMSGGRQHGARLYFES